MLRRLKILIAGLLVAAGLVAANPSSADAVTAPTFETKWACASTSGGAVTTCTKVYWARQADGTGVRLEGFRVETTAGCTNLEDSGGKYNPVTASFQTPAGAIDYYYNFGAEWCIIDKDLSNAGQDLHNMEFQLWAKARINLGTDKTYTVRWTLHPDGTYSRDVTTYY